MGPEGEEHRLRARLATRPGLAAGPGDFVAGRHEPLGMGDDRDGLLYVPDTAEPDAAVLVFLHGATGTGRSHARAILAAADRYGVVLVAPDSRSLTTWDLIADGRIGPDVAFLDRVLGGLADRLGADVPPERLAVGGVSDGASYALTVGLSNGDLFPTVLAFSPGFLAVAEPVGRPRVYVSHGTADPVLPIDRCSRSFVPLLERAGYDVRFDEFDGGHTVPPPVADRAVAWWLADPAGPG